MENKLPISAIIVGYNEADLLSNCFEGINFCDEILYIDLGSTDNSCEIVKKYNITLIHHSKVPLVEIIHTEFFTKTKHKWVLISDPDEVVSKTLSVEIQELFNRGIPEDVGAIFAPIIFFFKKQRLIGTNWGGVNSRVLLIHNERFVFSNLVHSGRKLREGFNFKYIDFKGTNFIYHYWMQSYKMLFAKHQRYLQHEGKARFESGQRTGIIPIIISPLSSFFECYFLNKGFKDGFVGLFLSLFWSWYQSKALFKLYRFEKNEKI